MKTAQQGIKLQGGYEIVEIQAKRHVLLERKKMERIKGAEGYREIETYRILWNDLSEAQQNLLLTYC